MFSVFFFLLLLYCLRLFFICAREKEKEEGRYVVREFFRENKMFGCGGFDAYLSKYVAFRSTRKKKKKIRTIKRLYELCHLDIVMRSCESGSHFVYLTLYFSMRDGLHGYVCKMV